MGQDRRTQRCAGPMDISTPEGRAYAVKHLGEDAVAGIEALFREQARHLPMVKCPGCAMTQAKIGAARARRFQP